MIVSGQKVILIVCFAIVGAILLMPEKSELMSRVIEDGDLDRALEMIGEKPTTESFDDLVEKYSKTSDSGVFQEITILITLVDDPKEALDCVIPNADLFSKEQKREICNLISKRGLELNDLDTALRGYQWLAQSVVLNDSDLTKAITISRYAGVPQIAIAFIKQNLRQRNIKYEDLPGSHRELLVALNREVNKGSEAMEFLKKELMLTGNNWSKWEVLELLTTVAIQSNKVKESLPVLEKYVATTEAGSLSWQDLLARSKGHPTDPKFLQFGKPLAQNYEWNSNADKAFSYYIKLALLGDALSLERCFALYDWAQKWEEMLELLDQIPRESLSYEQIVKYASLESSVTNYKEAVELCSEALAHPDAKRGKLHRQRGLYLLQQEKYEEAITDLEKAIDLDDENLPLLERIAWIRLNQGNYEEAMLTYRKLPFNRQSTQGYEHYRFLAETLQSEFDQLRIAGFAINDKSRATSSAYLDLHGIFLQNGKEIEAFEALELGLEEFPQSKKLKLAKVDFFLDRKDFRSAFNEIKQGYDKSDPGFIQRIIAIAGETEDPYPMIKILPLSDPYVESWDEGLRIEMALLYENVEELTKAKKIWESFDQHAVHIKQLNAKIAFNAGKYKEAMAHQENYVASTIGADADSWKLLGDIYKKMNRVSESEKAYTVATRKKMGDSSQPL